MRLDVLRIAGFDKDVILAVAVARGFLAARNIDITFDQVPNSTAEMTGLLEGKWDIAFDNGDNVVAWNEGRGADGETHDLVIFLGGAIELAQDLFVTPEISSVKDLEGKILGADAVATGFAVVLRYILQRHGLLFERDYRFKPVGSSRMRLTELSAGRISGAMLNPRYVEESGAAELRLLARGRDYADPYPARVGLTRRRWAAAHRSLLVRFTAAMIGAIDWALNPDNRAEAMALITSELKRSPAHAEADYSRLLQPQGGLLTRGAFMPETLTTALKIRSELGLIRSPLPPLENFYDPAFHREALLFGETH